jgi:hypothetical protein
MKKEGQIPEEKQPLASVATAKKKKKERNLHSLARLIADIQRDKDRHESLHGPQKERKVL